MVLHAVQGDSIMNVSTVKFPMSGFYLEKYFWGGSILQCNDYSSLLQKYALCRGSGGVSPRIFSDFEVSLSHF